MGASLGGDQGRVSRQREGLSRPLVAAAFDELAPRWDREHGPRSSRRLAFALRAALLRDLLRGLPSRRVLDVGCGTGQYLLAVADLLDEGVGIDISPMMVGQARANAGARWRDVLRFEVGSIEDGACTGPDYDMVLFYGSIEHLDDPQAALLRAARLLRPNGLIVVSMLNGSHPRSRLVTRALAAGRMPPLRLVHPRAVQAWVSGQGLVPVPLHRVLLRSRRVQGPLCWAAAALKARLTGSCVLVLSRSG